MRRILKPELLDHLPPQDPQASASRGDLRRLNFIMGHAGFLHADLRPILESFRFRGRAIRIVELGAGDGSLLLRVGQRAAHLGVSAEVTLVDRQEIIPSSTRKAFRALKWSITSITHDVPSWLEESNAPADVILANLFLHHFEEDSLCRMFKALSRRTTHFLCYEPRRSIAALAASHAVGLIGCNAITRHDAVVSVRAGFKAQELSALWPVASGWKIQERRAGLFSHAFAAHHHD